MEVVLLLVSFLAKRRGYEVEALTVEIFIKQLCIHCANANGYQEYDLDKKNHISETIWTMNCWNVTEKAWVA